MGLKNLIVWVSIATTVISTQAMASKRGKENRFQSQQNSSSQGNQGRQNNVGQNQSNDGGQNQADQNQGDQNQGGDNSDARQGGHAAYPKNPDQILTPGEICTTPESKRYAEQVAYCGRHVDPETKNRIMETYDRERGYRITSMNRGSFKIDHFIPLCMGGANSTRNLWPQHQSVYMITDSIEELSCEKMASGVLKQRDAIQLIRRVKLDLSKASEVTRYLNSL